MNTEIDMGKLNDWLESVRNTFINASELASKVAGMQQQVNEMSQTLDGLRQLNRTLDENLAWSRSERDRLDTALRQSATEASNAMALLGATERERDQYKQTANERASIIATLKSENDAIAFHNLELEEENAKLKATVDAINKALHPIETVSKPVPITENGQSPSTQPRDPVTQQWRPKAAYYDDKGDYHPAQVDDPNLPINPVEDWGKTSSGSF